MSTKTCSTHDSHDVRSKRFTEIRRKKCQHVKTYTWAKFWIDGTRLWIRQTENDPSSFCKLWLIQQWQVMKEVHTLFWPIVVFQNELHCCSKRGAIRKLFREMLSDGMLCFRFVWMSVICERHFLWMLQVVQALVYIIFSASAVTLGSLTCAGGWIFSAKCCVRGG